MPNAKRPRMPVLYASTSPPQLPSPMVLTRKVENPRYCLRPRRRYIRRDSPIYGIFEVLATAGDTHLGGEDFDNRVMDYMIKAYKKTGTDVSRHPRAVGKLKQGTEAPNLSDSRPFRICLASNLDTRWMMVWVPPFTLPSIPCTPYVLSM
jgi:Hsp70 protein